KEIAGVRKNDGHAGPDVLAANEGHLPDANAFDIGDRVERTWRENADRDTDLTESWALSGEREGECDQAEDADDAHSGIVQEQAGVSWRLSTSTTKTSHPLPSGSRTQLLSWRA